MNRKLLGLLITATALAFAFCGCNTILDNQPGSLAELDEAGTLPDPGTPIPGPEQPNVEGPDGAAPPVEKPSPGCEAGKRLCFGSCISMTDPLYGCGDPSCSPCPSSQSTMGCQGRKCVVAACDPGYADCNANAADGCETDLSKNTSCGACNAVCGAAAPLCAPAGPTFQCTNGCTPAAPLNCANDCVDPLTSVNHCGGCNIKCPAVANGTTACTVGACTFTCKPQFHACGGKCVAKTDPATCGPDCTPCPVPPGGTATCVADTCGVQCTAPNRLCEGKCTAPNDPMACGAACTVCPVPPNATATCGGAPEACGFQCTAGFGNCDMNAANGCESTFASDPLNCGMCGRSCAGQPCVNGVCQAAPPPP